jgi:hypothetical protein
METLMNVLDAKHHLLFLKDADSVLAPLQEISCPPSLGEAHAAFVQNLRGAMEVGHIPFFLARASVWRQRFNQLLASERILSLKDTQPGQGLSKEQLEQAEIRAVEKMKQEWTGYSSKEKFNQKIVEELLDATGFFEFADANAELNRQLTVLVWNSFEVLTADLIRSLLNSCPNLVVKLSEIKEFGGYFSSATLMAALLKESFDLSNKVGDFVANEVNLDSLRKVKAAVGALFGDADVMAGLKSSEMNRLYAKRNLIVHRRGVVDERYLSSCACDQKVGEKLHPDATSIYGEIDFIADLGAKLIKATAAVVHANSLGS